VIRMKAANIASRRKKWSFEDGEAEDKKTKKRILREVKQKERKGLRPRPQGEGTLGE